MFGHVWLFGHAFVWNFLVLPRAPAGSDDAGLQALGKLQDEAMLAWKRAPIVFGARFRLGIILLLPTTEASRGLAILCLSHLFPNLRPTEDGNRQPTLQSGFFGPTCAGGLGQACATLASLALEQPGPKWDKASKPLLQVSPTTEFPEAVPFQLTCAMAHPGSLHPQQAAEVTFFRKGDLVGMQEPAIKASHRIHMAIAGSLVCNAIFCGSSPPAPAPPGCHPCLPHPHVSHEKKLNPSPFSNDRWGYQSSPRPSSTESTQPHLQENTSGAGMCAVLSSTILKDTEDY